MSLFEPPTWETEGLRLSPFASGDEADALRLYCDDPEVTRFVGWPPLIDADSARRFLEIESRAWRTGDACRGWLARERSTGAAVAGLIARRHDSDAEFSYVVARDAWGRGIATELARALVERVRADDGISELWAICDVDNLASARVLEKAGFAAEGILSEHGRHHGFDEKRDCQRFVRRFDREEAA